MQNYKLNSLADVQSQGRIELHNALALTSAEVTINELPAGVSVPFVHAHKTNEETYIVLKGQGLLYIDGHELDIQEGDTFRIDPKGERCIKASDASSLRFICIQAKAHSLESFTQDDGVLVDAKPSWF